MIDRLSRTFYSKVEGSPLWGPVWSQVDLSGKRVLDYGCGNGGFSFLLASKGALVEGIDISESLVEIARRTIACGIPAPKFSVRDAQATGFPDASFDYVCGNGILHHLELEKAYPEIARVLKPGGRAFFMEPLEHHPLLVLLRKATPAARSVDEKPMTLDAIDMAGRFFSNVKHTEHFLFAVAAAPVHLASNEFACWAIKGLDWIDRGVFKAFPRLSRYAWLSMLEFGKF
ncbi:MAG TPA: class I SAM-dependent methyltransferase [Candidatus Acidoferrales bacterium]|nr:class I SAM-dependent methyltransferase [Candidatus Acidoferrales bacterium]